MTKQKSKSMIQRRLIPTYIFLGIVSFISVFPLYWMISAATNTSTDVSRGRLLPGTHFMENFKNLMSQQPLWRALGNSFLYAILTTVLCLLVCSIAGYGFEIYHDKWKDRLFSILLLAMMIPQVATMVPLFQMFSKAKLLNTAVGFMLPIISTPFMIMMFRQNARAFPVDIIEAARWIKRGTDFLPDVYPDDEIDLCGSRCYHIHECMECILMAKGNHVR